MSSLITTEESYWFRSLARSSLLFVLAHTAAVVVMVIGYASVSGKLPNEFA